MPVPSANHWKQSQHFVYLGPLGLSDTSSGDSGDDVRRKMMVVHYGGDVVTRAFDCNDGDSR